jgi:hypothetical protein
MHAHDASSLKVGFLFFDGHARVWHKHLIRELKADPTFRIHVLDCQPASPTHQPFVSPVAALGKLARAIERGVFLRFARADPSLLRLRTMGDLGAVAADEELELRGCTARGGVLGMPAEAMERVRDLGLDVLVMFSDLSCPSELLALPAHGVWAIHYADGRASHTDLPIGFWEVYYKSLRTMVALQRLGRNALDRWVIRRVWFQTEISSWTFNELNAMEFSKFLLRDALDQLRRSRSLPQINLDNFDSAEQPLSRAPQWYHYWLAILKLSGRRIAARVLHYFMREQWYLLAGKSTNPLLTNPAQLQAFVPPGVTWWADPFVFNHQGESWVFAEEKPDPATPAHICAFRWTPQGLVRAGIAISPDYHVSYPVVFEHEGHVYMLPETSSIDRIEIWECMEFPLRWEKRRVIMEGVSAADNTLLQHDGRWWLFTNISRSQLMRNFCVDTFIFSSTDPINGEWIAHDKNPVITDCRRARMAGPFVVSADGKEILRMAQSNSRNYGESLVMCRVDKLSQSEYEESLLRVIEPNWDARVVGTHHYAAADDLVVMDANKRVFR